MTVLLNIAVINALTVVPLAFLAYFASRLLRWPAMTHILWVLVLVKLVTPPIFQSPVSIELPWSDMAVTEESWSAPPVATTQREVIAPRGNVAAAPTVVPSALAPAHDFPIRVRTRPSAIWNFVTSLSPSMWFTLFWLGSAGLWISLQMLRGFRFQRRIMQSAVFSDELQRQTEVLGLKLGLKAVPQVVIVDVAMSPMLWGCGRHTRLLFPKDLIERLEIDSRATLLTHELAHFTRGDHWVRVLELVVISLFWWHPVVWWAKQQIEESEEECCDAWVVGEFPNKPRQYAEALLDTIDFLCEAHPALPPVASGLGHSDFLRRRLTKIMRGPVPKSLTFEVRSVVAVAASTVLTLQPFALRSASLAGLKPVTVESTLVSQQVSPSEPTRPDVRPTSSHANEDTVPTVNISNTALPMSSRLRAARGARTWSTAASADGRFVIRSTTAREVILTDRTSNREFDLSAEHVSAVAFQLDGESFVAAGSDGRITVWDAVNGELLRTVSTQSEGYRSVAISPVGDTVAAGSRDGSISLHHLTTGQPAIPLATFASCVNCVRFSPDGKQLAVATGDWMSDGQGEVMLIDVASGQTMSRLDCATVPGAVSFASNDELVVGLWTGQAQLWNLSNRQVVGAAVTDKNIVAAAAFSPDNPALLEVSFRATNPAGADYKSPLSLIQGILGSP